MVDEVVGLRDQAQQAQAYRGHERDTEPIKKQGNSLGVRL